MKNLLLRRLFRQTNNALWWIYRNHIINVGRPGYYDADELILAATRTIFFNHIRICHLDQGTGKLIAVHEGDDKWFDLYTRWQLLISEKDTSYTTARKLNTHEAWYAHAQKEDNLKQREQELYMELANNRESLWT